MSLYNDNGTLRTTCDDADYDTSRHSLNLSNNGVAVLHGILLGYEPWADPSEIGLLTGWIKMLEGIARDKIREDQK